MDWSAPRRFAVLTSLGGFWDGARIFTSERLSEMGDYDLTAIFPASDLYRAVSGSVELRIYGFGGEYGGQRTSLLEARLALASAAPLRFYTLAPCRAIDTSNAAGPLGGPSLPAGFSRTFALAGACGVPAGAASVSGNVTVPSPVATGFLLIWAAGDPIPSTSIVNFPAGRTHANNAIVKVSGDGALTVRNDGAAPVDVVFDVNGFFR